MKTAGSRAAAMALAYATVIVFSLGFIALIVKAGVFLTGAE